MCGIRIFSGVLLTLFLYSYMACILRLGVEGYKAVSEVFVVLNMFIHFVDTLTYLV